MNWRKVLFVTVIILIISAVAVGALYFLQYYQKTKFLSDKIPPNVLFPELDSYTVQCIKVAPLPRDVRAGSYKFKNESSFSDYFYRAQLMSVEKTSVSNCSFMKLSMESEYFSVPFEIYLPERMPSPATKKPILPEELSAYIGKKIEMQVRYISGQTIGDPVVLNGILGWKFMIIWVEKPY